MFDLFNRIQPVRVAVFGDAMLDTYTFGEAGRVSPEAPVLVVREEKSKNLPGGAGNVALGLAALGADVSFISRIGRDEAGRELARLLKESGVAIPFLGEQTSYPTTRKTRVISGGHHLLRIDTEELLPLDSDIEKTLIAQLPALLKGVQAIAISDYGKGFLTDKLLSHIIRYGAKHHIPVIVDPKGNTFAKYAGATLIKPNKKEAYEAAKCSADTPIEKVGEQLCKETGAQILITRSEEGMTLFADGKTTHSPSQAIEVHDVTGAGDAVLATIALGMANKLAPEEMMLLANMAGSVAVSALGCVQVTLSDIATRCLAVTDGILVDEDHLYALAEAVKGKPTTLLLLDEEQEMTDDLFLAIQSLHKKKTHLIISIKGRAKEDPFVELLSSLRAVDSIALRLADMGPLCDAVAPEAVYTFQEGKLEPVTAVAL